LRENTRFLPITAFHAIFLAIIARKQPKPSVSSLSCNTPENAMSTTQHFTEAKLEEAMITLLGSQGYRYTRGTDIRRSADDT